MSEPNTKTFANADTTEHPLVPANIMQATTGKRKSLVTIGSIH